MLAVIAVVLGLIANLPLVGLVIGFFAPVPVALAAVRHGLKLCLLTTILGGVVMFLVAGPLQALLFVIGVGGTGTIVGGLIRHRIRGPGLIVVGSLATMVLLATSLWGVSWLMGLPDPMVEMYEQLMRTDDMMGSFWAQLPIPPDELARQRQMTREMIEQLEGLITYPLFFLVSGAISGFLVWYGIISWTLRRLGTDAVPVPGFGSWRLPPFVALLLLYPLLIPLPPETALHQVPLHYNLFMVTLWSFFVIGLASIWHWSAVYGLTSMARGMLMVFAAMFFPLPVALVGLVDSLGDWRKPDATAQEAPPNSPGSDQT